mmetsp:Transcript_5526/g.7995  ORF Transcript_5526/g.7995 Transcript_5526/m.7995 type:complete len:95 (-) Transcript_5526:1264-1548(-)
MARAPPPSEVNPAAAAASASLAARESCFSELSSAAHSCRRAQSYLVYILPATGHYVSNWSLQGAALPYIMLWSSIILLIAIITSDSCYICAAAR